MKHKSYYMKRALKLAKEGLFTTGSNPRVGCVLVKNNKIIAEGYHQYKGQQHAESIVLDKAGDEAEGSTAYVTLEPCSHLGENPPCADELIKAKVKKVVICNKDPNPLVNGQGVEKLKVAGIEVVEKVLSEKGKKLNAGFLKRMKNGEPFVRLKMAQSLDGRTAMQNGDSYWITSKKSRSDVQYWRGRSQAVITAIETVLKDDCRMTVRPNEFSKKHQKMTHEFGEKQPIRVIFDSKLRIPLDAKILEPTARRVVFTLSVNQKKTKDLINIGVEVVHFNRKETGKINLRSALLWLGDQQVNEVLIEAGATLSGEFINKNLVDQLVIYTAPVIMGSSARPLFDIKIEEMKKRLHIRNSKIKQLGKDWRITADL